MDENSENIKKFEQLFKRKSSKSNLTLYNSSDDFHQQKIYTTRDVLSKLSLQLRAIQKGDVIVSKKQEPKLNCQRKSTFLPVNKMKKYIQKEPDPEINKNKFETQLMLDTQLIDVLDNVEALVNTNIGITQEFNSTFYEEPNDSNTGKSDNSDNKIIVECNGNNVNINNDNDEISNNNEMNLSNLSEDKQFNDNCTELFKHCAEIEFNDKIAGDIESDEDITCSFVFEPIKKSKTPSPLIFDLNKFEDFEKFALSYIENKNLDSGNIINSQIIGQELCLNIEELNNKNIFKTQKNLSPIIEANNDQLNPTKIDVPIDLNTDDNKNQEMSTVKIENTFLDDEILFSNDEESEYMHKEDLPLTCALKTSFYDQIDVLEKTMYVGFQTASNKSIQINKNSFEKAKNLFDEKDFSKATITELVDVCDELATDDAMIASSNANLNDNAIKYEIDTGIENPLINDLVNGDICFNDNIDDKLNQQNDMRAIENVFKKPFAPAKRKFNGFMTASNKTIKLSAQAVAKTKNVFDGIDLETNFNEDEKFVEEQVKEKSASTDAVYCSQIDDDVMKEFEQNISLLEDESEKFAGFKTASNKDIVISEAAKANSMNVFQGINIYEKFHSDINESEKENTIEASHLITESPDSNNIVKENYTETDKINNKPSTSKMCGFKTASNKDITISSKALDIGKRIYESIGNDNKINNSVGFKTASDKDIKISAEAYLKTKNMFDTIIDNEPINEFPDKKYSANVYDINKPVYSKDIDSKKTHEETKNSDRTIKKDCLLTKVKDPTKDKLDIDTTFKNTDKVFKGFKTASNKEVTISKEAIAKTIDIFKDIDVIESNVALEKIDIPMEKQQNIKTSDLFQTASQKAVKISADSLAKSRALLREDNNIKLDKRNTQKPFLGFQTANNKPIQITAQALAKSLNIFKDIDDPGIDQKSKEPLEYEKPKIEGSKFIGFQTASNKPVNVSENALIQSKLLFKDIDKEEAKFDDNGVTFEGFQTGNNRSVPVSDEAWKASKKVEQISNKQLSLASESNNAFGFQTASNKKVVISEEALNKSKKLLRDLDNNVCINNNENIQERSNLRNKEKFNLQNTNLQTKPYTINTEVKQSKDMINEKSSKDDFVDDLIDTQVLNNFEQTVNTEFFHKETPNKSKRSGSPILSCPRAKKRKKFETPYVNNINFKPQVLTDTKKLDNFEKCTWNNLVVDNYKKNKIYKLKDLVEIDTKYSKSFVDFKMAFDSIDDLYEFKFSGKRNDSDFCNNIMSVEDLKRCFLSVINKKLVPDGWLVNHIKLIIWKLISYELKYPNLFSGVCSVKNVIDQLKYRYHRELYNAERPALRKILEKDDVPSKSLVLCVAGIFENGANVKCVTNNTSNIELLLTDGWYMIKATIDKMLAKLVYDEKIKVGCKIFTNGAELVNCEQGIAPWEDISGVRLKLFGNSTRRARWDARLGYHGDAAILSRLSNVKAEGGKVSKLILYVTRTYPALFVEKFEDGSTVTRSERLENIHQAKCDMERSAMMEKLYEEVEKEMSDQESQDSDSNRRYNGSESPRNSYVQINDSQAKSLEERMNRRRERMIQKVQVKVQEKMEKFGLNARRNVVSLVKVRVADVQMKDDQVVVTKGLLSIWKPNDAIKEIVKEGSWIEVFNVIPTAVRYSEIQISAGRQSVFQEKKVKQDDRIKPYLDILKRKCYHIKDLVENPLINTDFNEIDTAGYVIQIDPPFNSFDSTKQQFQNVYIGDTEANIICINFWGGLKKFGYHNVLDTGQLVACVNLQKRTGNTKKSIPQYRVTEYSYITKTPKNVCARNLIDELVKKFASLDKRKYLGNCVNLIQNCSKNIYAKGVSPYRFNNDHNLTKNKIFIDSPLIKPVDDNLNLTGLDFESTFKIDTQELSPKTMLRKKRVNEKIAKLKMYGEPPPLSRIHIMNQSVSASKSYRSPVAKSPSVASSEKNVENSRNNRSTSPILSVNRTYAKNINPVKLDFSNQENSVDDDVDHFAEDFDGSPPLSLD